MSGVEYKPEFVKSPPANCSNISKFEFNLIYAFTTSGQSSNQWIEFQAKCQELFYSDIIMQNKSEVRSIKQVEELEKALKIKFNSKNIAHQKFLKKLERSNFHQLVLEIVIASSLNKGEWLTGVIIDLLKRNIELYPVWINDNIPKQVRARYEAALMRVFDIVNSSSIDEVYKLMLFKKFTHISTGDSRLKLTQLLNQTFGSALEFDLSSYKFGIKLAPFWVQELDDFKMKQKLVERYFNTPAMQGFDDYGIILFEYNIPNIGKKRDDLINKVATSYKSYNFEKMMALMVGLRNPVFKRELVKKDSFFERPIFSIERTYLANRLSEKNSSWIAFHLLYLGQRDENIIKNIMVDL
ncbi:hypothetical protein [Halobacteriovorax sp. RZ-2]|uniref:hypothetical protein n=1 Tax=unclassified Halobacteriovorax TaxID=2639665 RepID=UPI00371C2812